MPLNSNNSGISIPIGSIKSRERFDKGNRFYGFQFLLVQLKEE